MWWLGFLVGSILIAVAICYSLVAVTRARGDDDDFWTGY